MSNMYKKYKGILQENMSYIYKEIQKVYKKIQRNSYSNTVHITVQRAGGLTWHHVPGALGV